MAFFSAKPSQKVEKRQVKPQSLTSWKDGVLEFEDAQLSQVMNRIEEIYGWRAVYHDEELQARNISTPLPSNDLESALIMLSKAIGIRIDKVEEDKVLLLY
jgi:ferric-dicitrate binding protein FerR (iron transport regulator)